MTKRELNRMDPLDQAAKAYGIRKRGKGTSPTQLTLKYLRERGWIAEVVEKWIEAARKRKDLFDIGDIVAMQPVAGEISLVQTTTQTNHAKHRATIVASPWAAAWLLSGGGRSTIRLITWDKRRKPGTARELWTPRQDIIESISDLKMPHELTRRLYAAVHDHDAWVRFLSELKAEAAAKRCG